MQAGSQGSEVSEQAIAMLILDTPEDELGAHNLEEVEAPQRAYGLRYRKPSEAKRISLQEDWDKNYQLHERSCERVEQFCNTPTDEIPLEELHTLTEDISRQRRGSEHRLIQTELRNPDLEVVAQNLQRLSERSIFIA